MSFDTTLMGAAMILRPKFNRIHTVLSNKQQFVQGKVNVVNGSGNPSETYDQQVVKGEGYTVWEIDDTVPIETSGGVTAQRVYQEVGGPRSQSEKQLLFTDPTRIAGKTITISRKAGFAFSPGTTSNSDKNFMSKLHSSFQIEKNQPFCIRMIMAEPPSDWQQRISSIIKLTDPGDFIQPTGFKGAWEKIYPIPFDAASDTATFIHWGDSGNKDIDEFVLAFYRQTKRVSLFKIIDSNVKLVDTQSLPAKTSLSSSKGFDTTLFIYPIANQLILADSIALDQLETKHRSVTIFDFERPLNIGPKKTNIDIVTYLGSAEYEFLPVYHSLNGTFQSPFTSIPDQSGIAIVVDHEGGVGADASGNPGSGIFKYPVPDPDDSSQTFSFLKDTMIQAEVVKGAHNNTAYRLTLTSNTSVLGQNQFVDRFKCKFSPRIFRVEMRTKSILIGCELKPNPQIEPNDVISIQVTQSVEGSHATVVLNNRFASCPDSGSDRTFNLFKTTSLRGIKPLTISFGIPLKDSFSRNPDEISRDTGAAVNFEIPQFKGFMTKKQYQKIGSNKSTVTLNCDDVATRAKETYAINLPIYDGWCHLAAIYHLAKECGFDDTEIYFTQDPRTGDGRLLRTVMQGSVATERGGCWAGHAGKTDSELPSEGDSFGQSIPGVQTHFILDLPAFRQEPQYMFQMGTPIWECMHEIAKVSQWFLYVNNWGNLVYGPRSVQLRPTNIVFKEASNQPGKYDEIIRNLEVTVDSSMVRNGVMVTGLSAGAQDAGLPLYGPLIAVRKQTPFPTNAKSDAFIPWMRWWIERNPQWNDANRINANIELMFERSQRPRIFTSWTGWGRTDVYPYDIVTIDESLSNETGINQKQFIITQVQHRISADEGYVFNTSFEGEFVGENPSVGGYLNPNGEFSPHV